MLNKEYTKSTLKLAIPVMLTQLGQVSVNIFDSIIVGKLLGASALASVTLANSFFISFFIIGLGMSFAIPPLISMAKTQKNYNEINNIFSHGFFINIITGVILMILLFVLAPLIQFADQPQHIVPDAINFINILALGMIPIMAFQTIREVSEGLSYTIGVTIATILANIINIILNYIFIKGLFGISPMGIEGAAWATFVSRFVALFSLYFLLRKNKSTRNYIINFKLNLQNLSSSLLKKMLKLGFPTSMQMFFEVTAFATAAFICGLVSAKDIAAHQVSLSIASLTFNLCIGFSVASTVMIGNKMGEKNFIELKKIGINNLKITFIFMFFCGIIMILGNHIFPHFFAKKEEIEVIELASQLLIIGSLFQLSDGLQVASLGILRGLQDTKIPSLITFIAYWVISLPLSYYLCYELKWGAVGVWTALGIGLSISAILLILRFLKISSKKIKNM